MGEESMVAAALTAGVLIRMPGASPISGQPEAEREIRWGHAADARLH